MRLKELRKERHLTQTEVAKILNVAVSTYSGYELETSEPSITILKALSKLYNVPVDYIIDNTQNEKYIEIWKLSDERLANFLLIQELDTNYNLIAKGYLTRLLQEQISRPPIANFNSFALNMQNNI